jgi:hypothetical protein
VTTCGLRHFGGPEEDGGETFGLHGRASNLAAEDVAAERAWEGPDYRLRIRGRIAEAEVFKPTLVLERTISTALGSRGLRLDDRVTNAGCQPTSAMLLYHVNLGWPLLAEHSRLVVDAATIEPRTDHAAKDPEAAKKTPGVVSPKGPKGAAQKRHLVSFSQHAAMGPPTAGFEEQVYRLDPRAGADGLCRAALVNPKLAGGLALVLEWPKKTLPYLTQWKMMGQGTYVLGIEPCNAPLLARAELRRRGLMPELGPGESFETSLALRVAVGAEEIRDLHAGRQGQGHGWNRRERRERGARRRRGRENN